MCPCRRYGHDVCKPSLECLVRQVVLTLTSGVYVLPCCCVLTGSNPPGRGGPWWNDPTYWIGLLLGVGLGYPLINRFILNKTTDKEVVSQHKAADTA